MSGVMGSRVWLLALSVVVACHDEASAPPTPPASGAQAPASPSTTASTPSPPAPTASTTPRAATIPEWAVQDVGLPGATPPASLDYIAYESSAAGLKGRVWVPVGVTGSVDVFDVGTRTMTRVDGFKTAEREAHGSKRVVGPSSVAIGQGFAYVGNRATKEVCPVNITTLKLATCLTLAQSPDGVAYVSATKQVWVTTPSDESLTVLDASHGDRLALVGTVKVGGAPEGYAVDDTHGLFFTNLEDKNKTVVLDVRTRTVKATWTPSCGEDGPRGLAVDDGRGLLFVACTDHVQVLDADHEGAPLGRLETGEGVDNLDYRAHTGTLYVAAGKAARLTIAEVGGHGELHVVGTATTHPGARNAVSDGDGNAYVGDSQGARLVVASRPTSVPQPGASAR